MKSRKKRTQKSEQPSSLNSPEARARRAREVRQSSRVKKGLREGNLPPAIYKRLGMEVPAKPESSAPGKELPKK